MYEGLLRSYQNSSKDKKICYPLYFNAMNLNFNLKLNGTPNIRAGLGTGTLYKCSRGSGVVLTQKKDSLCGIYSGLDTSGTLLGSGGRAEGMLDIDDGTIGITAVTRYFYQMYPNGIQVNSTNRLQIQLWPEWSNQINYPSKNPGFNSSGLYWLADMQHVYKEVYIYFHASGKSDAEIMNFTRTVNYHPVVSLKREWYSFAKASVDLEGLIPLTQIVSTSDKRIPEVQTHANLGWDYFAIIDGRRTATNNAGNQPIGAAQFFITENPSEWYDAEMYSWGEINIRPNSMAQYNFKRDWPFLHLGINSVNAPDGYLDNPTATEDYNPHGNWREQNFGATYYDSALIAESVDWNTILIGRCDVRQPPHAWFYHVADAYFMSGNPWIKDWYKFILEYRKCFIDQGKWYPSTYGSGHWYAQALTASSVMDDTLIPGLIANTVTKDLLRQYVKNTGGLYNGSQVFEEGFQKRSFINAMYLLKDRDPQAYSMFFQTIASTVHFNMKYANWSGVLPPSVVTNTWYDIAGSTFLDCQSWYYWHTGRRQVRDSVFAYQSGQSYIGFNNSTDIWWGGCFGRWYQFIRDTPRPDSIPPNAITDLRMTRNGTSCQLQWTAPADAKHYHISWDTIPIVDSFLMNDFDLRYRQWYGANPAGNSIVARPGQTESFTFTGPASGRVCAVVFSFDSVENMSLISNNGTADPTPPSAPTNLKDSIVNAHEVLLSWSASSDVESGIYGYNIYKNGSRIASVYPSLTLTDINLPENTDFNYEVSAVSGTLVESQRVPFTVKTPADNASPSITSVFSVDSFSRITVVFDELIDKTTAENAANYSLDNGTIVSSVIQSDGKSVLLTSSGLVWGTTYTLSVINVKDLAITQNPINMAKSKSFVCAQPFTVTQIKPDEKFIWEPLRLGMTMFSDWGEETIGDVPAKYINMPYCRTSEAGGFTVATGDSVIQFLINQEAYVYVAYPDAQRADGRLPSWLDDGWGDTDEDFTCVSSSGNRLFSLYGKRFEAGMVNLGGCNGLWTGSNYSILVVPTDTNSIPPDKIHTTNEPEFTPGIAAYPNPFNPAVTIVLQCNKQSGGRNVLMYVYDINGREIARLSPVKQVDAHRTSRFTYSWNDDGKPSGMYLFKANIDNKVWKKMAIMIK